jgi:kynureninase
MITRDDLLALDRTDPLAHFRDLFMLPDNVVYLDGNSLGALPRATPGRIAAVVADEWGNGLIRSWNDAGWIDMPGRIAGKIGRLIGAPAACMMVADSTSVNLFKLLYAALDLRPNRRVIVTERGNFPTDIYIAEGLARLLDRGHMLRLVEPHEIIEAIDDDVAVVMLTHVSYHSGAMLDMATITARAHEAGAIMLWDLAHSAGAVPIDLVRCEADLAVGCGYKFLNGGPGAPAFMYVAERLLGDVRFPLTGWLGHAAPFAFEHSYRPAPGIAGAIVGTPPMLSLAALEVGVDIALQAPIARVREKSVRQTVIFAELVEEQCPGLALASPRNPHQRGSQVCFRHEHAYAVMQALIARGVIGDFRAPDILRFGITPLYLGYADLWDAVQTLGEVLATREWESERFRVRNKVT